MHVELLFRLRVRQQSDQRSISVHRREYDREGATRQDSVYSSLFMGLCLRGLPRIGRVKSFCSQMASQVEDSPWHLRTTCAVL